MKLHEPLTNSEIDAIKRAIKQGGTLGLGRTGDGEERYQAVSLLDKLVAEYEQMRVGEEVRNAK